MKELNLYLYKRRYKLNFNEQLLFPKYLNYRYTLIKIKNI